MARNYSTNSDDDYESFLENLANEAPEEADDVQAAPPMRAPAPPSIPVPVPVAPAQPAPAAEDQAPPSNSEVSDFIKYKQLLGDDEQALRATREASRARLKDVNLAQAFGDLGAGIAGEKVDPTFYNNIKDQEATSVKGAESGLERNRKLVHDYITNERMADVADENRQARVEVAKENAHTRAQLAKDSQDSKNSDRQDRAYVKLRHDLESFRGNQAVQLAAQGVLSANKAIDLVAGKDPNTLTTQDLRLLNEEISKIATGGVPGEHGVQALMPNNLQTKFAEMKNFYLSKPTDAQAAEYIKHNMDYLQKIKESSQSVLSDYRRNVAKGYKHSVRQEDYDEALTDYGLNNPPTVAPASSPKPSWAK